MIIYRITVFLNNDDERKKRVNVTILDKSEISVTLNRLSNSFIKDEVFE